MQTEYIIIISSFILVGLIYYFYLNKSVNNKIDIGIDKIFNDISALQNKVAEHRSKLTQLETGFVEAEIKFKQSCIEVEEDIEKIKLIKLSKIEDEFEQKSKDIESEAVEAINMHQIQITNKIIQTAYLLSIEYLKNHAYDQEKKKRIINKLLKDIRFN